MRDLKIGLDFLTISEYSAHEQIEAAARHGIESVNLLVQPFPKLPYYNLIGDSAGRRRTLNQCRAMGVTVEVIEPFIADV